MFGILVAGQMARSQITQALRQERRERLEQALRDKDPASYRDYIAEKSPLVEDRRDEITGY